MKKIKTIIENPVWSFIGAFFGILAFSGVKMNMITHTVLQYSILAIALLLAIHGSYRLWKKNGYRQASVHPTESKFIVDEGPGWLTNPKTNEIFCLSCWYNNEAKIHLIKNKGVPTEWICPKCNKTYMSPLRMLKYYFASNLKRPT